MGVVPESRSAIATRVVDTLIAEIGDGRLGAAAWEVEGPVWDREMNGRTTHFTHRRPSGTEIRARWIDRTEASGGYARFEVLICRDGAVIVELYGDDAQPLVTAVRDITRPAVESLAHEVAREFGA